MRGNEINLKELFVNRRIEPLLSCFAEGPGWSIGYKLKDAPQAQQDIELEEKQQTTDKNGLKVICGRFRLDRLYVEVFYHLFPDGKTLSIDGRIVNDQKEPSPLVRQIRSFLQNVTVSPETRIISTSLCGGTSDSSYPPHSFTLRRSELLNWMTGARSETSFHGGMRGRSTDNDMPYFVVQLGEKGGLFFALEWPGDWGCRMERNGESVCFQTGIEGINLTLLPGESIPLPGALIGLYTGDWIEGCNALRQTIADYYTPKLNGKAIVPPVFYNSWWAVGLGCDEARMKKEAEACAHTGGIEYFTQDAGWYAGCKTSFGEGIGNWFVDSKKYPRGLKPLADFVREKKMKFGLFIEPERASHDSWLAKEHPDWIVNGPEPGDRNLVDFGKPEVVNYFSETMDTIFKENNVEWIRFDSNINPQPRWHQRDPVERQGISQIRHFEGLLKFWDHLLMEHPTLLIEGCSSGGRRMDLACLKRSHTYWCNDQTVHFDLVRYDLTGANLLLPANYLNHAVTSKSQPPDDYVNPELPPFAYHCHMGGTFGFAMIMQVLNEKQIISARKHIEVFKKIRHLLLKKYVPLFGQPIALEGWDGWQFHDPERDEGVVFIFRCLSPEVTSKVQLHWLNKSTTYQFSNLYNKEIKLYSGRELYIGVDVSLNTMRESQVWHYRKLK